MAAAAVWTYRSPKRTLLSTASHTMHRACIICSYPPAPTRGYLVNPYQG